MEQTLFAEEESETEVADVTEHAASERVLVTPYRCGGVAFGDWVDSGVWVTAVYKEVGERLRRGWGRNR